MEEDIKILEEIKKDIVYDSDEDYDNQVAIRQIQALENLIKAYREKEESEKEHKKVNGNLWSMISEMQVNSIPKSKIKEKIEEQYELWNTPNKQKEYSQEVVDILQELLEEK